MGECHYLDGNYKAKARAQGIRIVLQEKGINPDRFDLQWVSSAEASRFANLIRNFVQSIRELGPNPLKGEQSADAA